QAYPIAIVYRKLGHVQHPSIRKILYYLTRLQKQHNKNASLRLPERRAHTDPARRRGYFMASAKRLSGRIIRSPPERCDRAGDQTRRQTALRAAIIPNLTSSTLCAMTVLSQYAYMIS